MTNVTTHAGPYSLTTSEFANFAIKNGYTDSQCEGWDWIRENLSSLDKIWQSESYKSCKGMKSACMSIIMLAGELNNAQERVLQTAWYLNNERVHEAEKQAYHDKWIADGWADLTCEVIQKAFNEKKKLRVSGNISTDWFTNRIDAIYKPFVSHDGNCYLMKPKARNKGMLLTPDKKLFYKEV